MTSGISIEIGWPSIAASASIPPTPQPTTPRPLTIVVCESVPDERVRKRQRPAIRVVSRNTTRARYSRLTWWTMPVSGGTALKLLKACWPQRRNWYRSLFRANSSCALRQRGVGPAEVIDLHRVVDDELDRLQRVDARRGRRPSRATPSRMAARSTTAGTPVKSCSSTRAGVNAISFCPPAGRVPVRERPDVLRRDERAVLVAEQVLEEDLERVRQPRDAREPVLARGRRRLKTSTVLPGQPDRVRT